MKLILSAPATIANVGGGFDTFALAINLRNEIIIEESSNFSIIEKGIKIEGEDLFLKSFKMMMRKYGLDLNYKIEKKTMIPPKKGLGSSAASVVLGIAAAMAINGSLSRKRIFEIASETEGHPDNAAACVYGGFTVSGRFENNYVARSLSPIFPYLTIVIPPFSTSTHEARKVLPKIVSLEDAVFNVQHVAMVVANLGKKMKREFFEDKLHQERRLSLYPELKEFFERIKSKTNDPVFICGSGSALAVAGIHFLDVPSGWEVLHKSASKRGLTVRRL
ncbi:MAG: homoserine kinase [Athalassotoga sp.]|uniref:homoserine kinase n=1 Tax=Athalassotoga sp. TaxID=2022597 RepID=UPI003D08E5FA